MVYSVRFFKKVEEAAANASVPVETILTKWLAVYQSNKQLLAKIEKEVLHANRTWAVRFYDCRFVEVETECYRFEIRKSRFIDYHVYITETQQTSVNHKKPMATHTSCDISELVPTIMEFENHIERVSKFELNPVTDDM